ncbi:MAG TPA: flavodoxin domain-containing protein [Nocardioidaceae bacterium]|nr:flavodoxin domain-containing protein [Nocardioidaceae bacterium]
MKALIVYESMFGNTGKVAEAVAEGVRGHMAVELVATDHAPAALPEEVDLLVVGGPTHAFSMTRANTREDAVRQGATAATTTGIREWIGRLHDGAHGELVATFDTRVARTGGRVRHFPGSAAKSAAKALRKAGFEVVVPPESFWVEDTAGPLFEGETERARQWGERIAAAVEHKAGAR